MSKNYCLTGVAASLQLGKGNAQFTGNSATEIGVRNALDTLDANLLIADPIAAQHAATKSYVDGLANGLSWKQYVRVCTTTFLAANTRTANTLTADADGDLNTAGIDGINNLVVGDAVLVQNEVDAISNGIYEVADLGSGILPWVLTRRADAVDGDDATSNATFCAEGTVGADKAFVQTADAAIYGTTALVYAEFASVTAGVTSVADAAAVPAGGESLIAAGPTGAVTLNVVALTATIDPTVAGGIMSLDVVANSIGAGELANAAVGSLQLADAAVLDVQRSELAGIVVRHATFDFNSGVVALTGPGAAQNLELNKSYLVMKSQVCVETAFDDATAVIVVQKQNNLTDSGTPTAIQDSAESDLFVQDNYVCETCQSLSGNGVDPWKFQITVTPAAATVGAGRAIVLAVKLD